MPCDAFAAGKLYDLLQFFRGEDLDNGDHAMSITNNFWKQRNLAMLRILSNGLVVLQYPVIDPITV